MASAARSFTRALRTPATSSLKRSATFVPRTTFAQQARRGYADAAGKKGGNGLLIGGLAAALAGGAGFYFLNGTEQAKAAGVFTPKQEDYQKVYDKIAALLVEHDNYDDGSYGPVLVRLAWHASGTYDAMTNTGGSNGATMRFPPEGDHGANAGLHAARDFLEPVKSEFCRDMKKVQAAADNHCRGVPLDHLLRSLDPGRCRRHPGDAGPQDSLETWPQRP